MAHRTAAMSAGPGRGRWSRAGRRPRGSRCAGPSRISSAATDRPAARTTPDSISTTVSARKLGENTLGDQAGQLRLEGGGLVDVFLGERGRPADRGHRVAVHAAGVDADRQAVAFRGGVDRPVLPAAQGGSLPTSSMTWTKRRSGAQRLISSTASSAFCIGTMIEARSRGSRSSHSRAIQSFSARAEGDAEVLAELRLHAIQAVADRQAACRTGPAPGAQRGDVGRRAAGCVAPVVAKLSGLRVG